MDRTSNLNFNTIKQWVQNHLKNKNTLLSCSNVDRKVIINTITGHKFVEIPPKRSNSDVEWTNAWIKVYETCLTALEDKVQFLCMNDPLVTHVSGYKIKVGNKLIVLPSDTDDITYINTLELIVNLYETLKKEAKEKTVNKAEPIVVNYSSIKIDKPSVATAPETVQSIRMPEPASVTKTIKETIEETKEILNKIIGQKVADEELLSKTDCNRFKTQNDSFVLITCTDLNRGEEIFISNADLCQAENIPMGAFISGNAISEEQGISESKKIAKLLSGYKIVGPVLYEINNNEIRNNKSDHAKVIAIVDTCTKVADELNSRGYKPFICMDSDIEKIIHEVHQTSRPDYKARYKAVLRILPREKENIDENKSTVLMDPISDYDLVTINF